MDDMDEPTLAELQEQIVRLQEMIRDVSRRLPPQLVSQEEAAAALDVSTRTMKRWVKDRKVPFVKVGGKVRVDMTALRSKVPLNDRVVYP
jgi:excisionase family DNA binding protein